IVPLTACAEAGGGDIERTTAIATTAHRVRPTARAVHVCFIISSELGRSRECSGSLPFLMVWPSSATQRDPLAAAGTDAGFMALILWEKLGFDIIYDPRPSS